MPPITASVVTTRVTRWLMPSWLQRVLSWLKKGFIQRAKEKKRQGREKAAHRASNLHAHQLLVGLHELVPDLDHQREGRARLLHGDHRLVQVRALAAQHLGLLGLRRLHLPVDL